ALLGVSDELKAADTNISKRSDTADAAYRSVTRLFRKEHTVADVKFCERLEVLLVIASNCVFLPAFNAETTLSCRVRLDLYHKRGIHERRTMDPNESVRLQLFCHPRD